MAIPRCVNKRRACRRLENTTVALQRPEDPGHAPVLEQNTGGVPLNAIDDGLR